MSETKIARLFKIGDSQVVRLPADFRFEGSEVYITRDDSTGDLVLSARAGAVAWSDFFELMRSIDVPEDFMAERPMNALPSSADN